MVELVLICINQNARLLNYNKLYIRPQNALKEGAPAISKARFGEGSSQSFTESQTREWGLVLLPHEGRALCMLTDTSVTPLIFCQGICSSPKVLGCYYVLLNPHEEWHQYLVG